MPAETRALWYLLKGGSPVPAGRVRPTDEIVATAYEGDPAWTYGRVPARAAKAPARNAAQTLLNHKPGEP